MAESLEHEEGTSVTSEIAYFNFIGTVNEVSARYLMKDIRSAIEDGASGLHINVASPGGRTQVGFALYNFLSSLPIKLRTHSFGFVDSAAMPVFLAGDERTASPVSSFMIHNPTQDLPHSAEFGRFHLSLLARELELDEEFMRMIFTQTTKMTSGEVGVMLSEGRRLRPQEALELGIVSAVELFAAPAGAHIRIIGV